MIEDDDEIGEGTGSPCDKIICFLAGILAVYFLAIIAYFLTR